MLQQNIFEYTLPPPSLWPRRSRETFCPEKTPHAVTKLFVFLGQVREVQLFPGKHFAHGGSPARRTPCTAPSAGAFM